MADSTDDTLKITIYAAGDTGADGGKPVPADVFVRKMQEVLEALNEADRSANGGARHEFLIADLKKGSAEVTFSERSVSLAQDALLASSFLEFEGCVDAIYRNDLPAARRYGKLVDRVSKITAGAGQKFGYIAIERTNGRDYRADKTLHAQALSMLVELRKVDELKRPPRMFSGQSFEGFDGSIKEVDLRSKVKRCKLVLSDGTKELDCEFDGFELDTIKEHLDRRVWAEGTATYSGEGGLPVRFSIRTLRQIRPKKDLSRWRGAVQPSSEDGWLD
jgi:hypothetical protein